MRAYLFNKWTAVLVTGVAVVVAISFGFQAARFKDDLLTRVVPNLLASIFAIAAVMERATAVLNNIWFGEEREHKEEAVRVTGKMFAATKGVIGKTIAVQDALVKEAVRSRSAEMLARTNELVVAPEALVKATNEEIDRQGTDLLKANEELVVTENKMSFDRLIFSFVASLAISAVGIRILSPMVELGADQVQSVAFTAIDVVLTAGVLAGGTSAVSAISDLLGSYTTAARKRTLENG